MSLLGTLTNAGVSIPKSQVEKRNVLLTNYISLVATGATLLLLIGRLLFATVNASIIVTLSLGIVLFLIPILINALGFTVASRLALCWLPALFQLVAAARMSIETPVQETSNYLGLRYLLLGFSCFPFLIFEVSRKGPFIAGLMGPFLSILLFDPFLNYWGLGYFQTGLHDQNYQFNNVRILVSFLTIGASSYFLKSLVTQNENENERLVTELAEKNKLIQLQASEDLLKLNQQLNIHLQELIAREFILNQSQRIAKMGSWEYRIKDSFIFWSDEMYAIFGLDPGFDLKANSLSQLMWAEHGEILTEATVAMLRTAQPYDLTLKARNPFGHDKWIRVNAFPILENEHVIGVRGICHDVTYYKESGELMRAGENKYRTLFEQASDFIMILDFKGRFIDVNASLCTAFGYSKEELSQMTIEALIEPNQLKEEPIHYEELDRGEHILNDRLMRHKNGTIIDVEANVKKIQEDRMLVIARDVTELRKIQKQVQLSEARFRSAFEHSAIGMAWASLEGKWLKVNKKLCEIVGYSETELLAMTFQEITHPEDLAADVLNLSRSLKGEIENFNAEKRYIRRNGSVCWVNLNVSLIRDSQSKPLYFSTQVEDISERKRAENEKELARYLLKERIKEMTTLYRTSQVLQGEKKSIANVMQEIVAILPPGWQYPEITAARIEFDKSNYTTPNYNDATQKQIAEFVTDYGAKGTVEVVYLEDKPLEAEGAFLAEERNLINMVAEMLQIYLSRTYVQETLRKSEANMNATINNTEVLIWSVDRAFKVTTFNKPFFDYIRRHYQVEISYGSRVLGNPVESPFLDEVAEQWIERYMRVLSGEVIKLEEERFGIYLQYSLSPIIEGGEIIGVSIFADNVTERRKRDKELAEAQEKIGELKLMALRSVMSPHFIFNVLNSIQYYIAKNDRVNAITYLSTFSKLIRSILNQSANNKIKLSEEIDMLRNYVQLEMTRFEDKFDFVMEIDQEMDVDGIEIPSLLIQPYVENAILHGLYNKVDKGTLTIRITENQDAVVFEIEDNGVGRKEAQRLRQQNFPTHKSMGIKLTEERLKMINKQNQAAFEIEDLSDNSGPTGTKVRIRVLYQ